MNQKFVVLNNGIKMPLIGLGTWRSKPGDVGNAVEIALKTGYRHVDCAHVYLNEKEVGKAIKNSKIKRSDLFITSKLWNTFHQPHLVESAFQKSLQDLGLEYLDLYLLHWPVAFMPGPLSSTPTVDTSVTIKQTWQALEKLVALGKVKTLGVSNFGIKHFEHLSGCKIQPAVNQVEMHPYLTQEQLLDYCKKRNIVITAYSPLGSRPGPDSLLKDSKIIEIAKKYSKTPAQVLLSWGAKRSIVIPKSTTPARIIENFDLFELDPEDINTLNSLNKNKRYVDPSKQWKVQLFE